MKTVFPIDEIEQAFIEAVDPGRPLVVTAPTGSGKSTRLPVWMVEKTGGPVLVVEPRRVACRSLASFLCRLLGGRTGEKAGYRIRFENCCTKGTKVLFVTPGVALRMLQSNADKIFSAVMIDEFHERGWESDLFLTILLERKNRGDKRPLVVTSATIDAQALANTLSARRLHARGRLFPVEIVYRGQGLGPSTARLAERVCHAIKEAASRQPGGDILVFLPGKKEISNCAAFISGRIEASVFRVHGSMSTGRIAGILGSCKGGRRVILSTNVAETSITIPGISCVIDSGLRRIRRHRAGRTGLVLEAVSRDSMEQRAGRAGRTAPGLCIRLWSRSFIPLDRTEPEIARVELDNCMLMAAACGLSAKNLGKAPWPEKPPAFALDEAFKRLSLLGALNSRGGLTDLGEKLMKLPVPIHLARLLVDVPVRLAPALCDLAAVLQARSSLLLPNAPGKVHDARKILFSDCRDEVSATITCLRRGDVKLHGLNDSVLSEARKTASSLRSLVGCRQAQPEKDESAPPRPETLADFLLLRRPESAFVLRQRGIVARRKAALRGVLPDRAEPWANGKIEIFVTPHKLWNNRPGCESGLPRAGLVFEQEWIGSEGTDIRGVGRMILPCSYSQIIKAGLGSSGIKAPRLDRTREEPTIRALREISYAGVVLSSGEIDVTGNELCRAAAELILRNSIFPGLAGKIRDQQHVLRLVAEFKPACRSAQAAAKNLKETICERLLGLGVESPEDIWLLNENDLLVDLSEITGLDTVEIDEISDEFPRLWSYQGAVFECSTDRSEKTVTLSPQNKKATSIRNIPRWVLPPFRRFRIRLRRGNQFTFLR